MHKAFLTLAECSIIDGADKIIKRVGDGFPSMENGALINVSITMNEKNKYRYDIQLDFDISGWKRTMWFYNKWTVHKSAPDIISMRFEGARDVYINSPRTASCGEIKFSNTTDRKTFHQDCLPEFTPDLSRPYSCFYICSGDELVIEFTEDECRITAE